MTMDAGTKKAVCARLRRVAGQVKAVERMVETDRSCIELIHQLDAVQAALGKAGEVVLRSHLQAWVREAIRGGDAQECRQKVEEMVSVLGRYRRIRERQSIGSGAAAGEAP